MTDIEQKLEQAGLVLPQVKQPLGAYVAVMQSGNLLYVSGQGPVLANSQAITGRLGDDLDIEDGHRAAQICALNIVAQLKFFLDNDWARLKQIVQLTGYINSTPDFTHQPAVLNGASELLQLLFGEGGRHSRVAVGVAALPMNWAVEIAAIIEVY
ncbi:MAG: RidA family protein [Parvibaculales bacterium]